MIDFHNRNIFQLVERNAADFLDVVVNVKSHINKREIIIHNWEQNGVNEENKYIYRA